MSDREIPAARRIDRRRFLISGAGVVAAATLAEHAWARPFAPLPARPLTGAPHRVRGRVHAGARGLPRVGVSDGLQVVETGADGTFELLTSSERPFVQLTVPAGYRVPVSAHGTARAYAPLSAGDETSVEFALEPLEHDDANHTLLLLADIQTQTAEEMRWFHERTVPDVRATVAAADVHEVFGIADGDIMYDHLELYPEYERAVSRMGVPFFQVPGNHDLDFHGSDEASTSTFMSRFGPTWYSFDRGAVHYVVLDDVFWHGSGYIGYLTGEMLAWLRADLARVEAGRPVIVATHIPALGSFFARDGDSSPEPPSAITNRAELYRLLEPYRAHILTGHTHENEHVFEQGTHEHVSGTVCGAWWSGPICWDGTPSGYAVYEVRGEQVTWRYKATGEAPDHQLRLYPRGSDPTAPGEIVANVWDWDPEWNVVWFEDGERRGPMARRLGLDPLSVRLHSGQDQPPHRPWVDPRPTDHLFYAPVSEHAREILVEATDRFGGGTGPSCSSGRRRLPSLSRLPRRESRRGAAQRTARRSLTPPAPRSP